MKRIGMLTSGGDCQALNATMRGVAKGLYNTFEDVEVYGFLEGYKGLIYGNYVKMKPSDFSGILTKGGTILGSSRQPFKLIDEPTPEGLNKVEEMKKNYNKLKLDALLGSSVKCLTYLGDIIWNFRNQDDVCTGCDTRMQCNPAYLMSHNFYDKYTVV